MPATEQRPNILFILMDDVRFDDLGYAGHPFVQTPNIDRLAREGAQFSNAFAATPLCSPNRASILTGQYAHTHGILDNVDRSALTHQLVTFPRILQENGYDTAFVGKWHMGVDDSQRPGFNYWLSMKGQGDYFDPELNENGETKRIEGYTTDILSDKSIEFLSKDREEPFLLYLSQKAVHPNLFQAADASITDIPADGGFTPPGRHLKTYSDQAVPRRPNAKTYGEGKPALMRKIEGLPPLGPETATDDEAIRNRLRILTAADEGIGRILAKLEEMGALDSTVIIFTSDHGYFYGEHGLNEERRLAYEETARTPLIIHYPKLARAGASIDKFALSIDLAPTMLELGEAPAPAEVQGRSLLPLLRGEPVEWRDSILIEYFSDKVWPRLVTMGYQAVRTADWKYIHYVELDGMDELYHLSADPYEMSNVIDDPEARPKLEELRAELDKLLKATGGEMN